MITENQIVTLFNNYDGSVTINSGTAGVLTQLPDEQSASGNPEFLSVGDTITFNEFQTADASVSDTDLSLTEQDDGAIINNSVFGQAVGTQINGGYGVELTDPATGLVYNATAYSYGENNDDLDEDGRAIDITDGWVFSGENGIPPEGRELEVSNISGSVGGTDWNDVSVICFANGSYIETKDGACLVEDLKVGDMVLTADSGFQPLKHIYKRKVASVGSTRPVVFEKGAIGNTEKIRVSQRHRMLTTGMKAPNGKSLPDEYLIWAIELCNGSTIRIDRSVEEVTYFHLMFDQHELVYSSGVLSESWQPTKKNLEREPELAEELLAIFPEIEHMDGQNQGRIIRDEITINPSRQSAK